LFYYIAPFTEARGRRGGGRIFTPVVGLLKNLQSSFLETLKIL